MRVILRFALVLGLVVAFSVAYLSPLFRPKLESVWQELASKYLQLEEEVGRSVGFSSPGNPTGKTIEVQVPRSRGLDWQAVGALSKSILGGGYSRIKVEVDSTARSTPPAPDLVVIRQVLEKYSGKPVQVSLDQGNIPVQDNYTLQLVADLTKNNRSCYTAGTEFCLYLLYLPGKFEQSTALAASITASTIIVFSEQMDSASGPLASRERISQATLTHELGHLFGLVNLIYHSSRPHEDSSHSGHSKNPASVMYWAVEDFSIGSILSGGPPTTFDQDDEFDIGQIKEGKI